MPNRFSEVTNKIQEKLPYWFKKMRTDNDSIGAQFLNVFGLQIEDVEYITEYAYNQTNIRDLDVNQINMVYKFFIPHSINNKYDILVNSYNHILTEVHTLEEFFVELYSNSDNSEVDYKDPFFIVVRKVLEIGCTKFGLKAAEALNAWACSREHLQ